MDTHEDRDPRLCEHVNEDGTLCKGWKAKGGKLCAGHAGLGIAASPDAARAAQAAGAARRSEVAESARKRAVDVYRDALDRSAPGRRDGLTVAQAFAEARIQIALDDSYGAGDRLRAMEQLEARAIGRPTEHLEVDTGDEAQRAIRETFLGLDPAARRELLLRLNRPAAEA